MRRNLEVLVSSLEKDPGTLISHMNLECDAVIVNQCDRNASYEFRTENGLNIKLFESVERGVGRSRNKALDLADSKIVLFADDDIVYDKGYAERILETFNSEPEADILMFNVNVCEERRTYQITKKMTVHKWSVGRYPAFAAAARLGSIKRSGEG